MGGMVDVHDFTSSDWSVLSTRGVAWQGVASLARFVNNPPAGEQANVVFREGWLYTTRDIAPEEELFAHYHWHPAFWA